MISSSLVSHRSAARSGTGVSVGSYWYRPVPMKRVGLSRRNVGVRVRQLRDLTVDDHGDRAGAFAGRLRGRRLRARRLRACRLGRPSHRAAHRTRPGSARRRRGTPMRSTWSVSLLPPVMGMNCEWGSRTARYRGEGPMGSGLYPLVHLLDVAVDQRGDSSSDTATVHAGNTTCADCGLPLHTLGPVQKVHARAWIGACGTRKRRPSAVRASSTAAPNSSRTRAGLQDRCRSAVGGDPAAAEHRPPAGRARRPG